MDALKIVQQKKHTTAAQSSTQTSEYAPMRETDLVKLFPSPRYFQIHFQQLHQNTDNLKTDTQSLKQAMSELNAKMDFLLQLFMQTHY